jgi:hypothetical protein
LALYVELKSIELELKSSEHSTDDAAARLDRLEERANQLRLPVAFASLLYDVRSHIELVRTRLAASTGVRGPESDRVSSIDATGISRTLS